MRDFLRQYGYRNNQLENEPVLLREHFNQYYKGRKQFPHELGVFLEYPLSDVEGFIKHDGKNSILSGYWKVYQDCEKAQETFRKYDRAKEIVEKVILSGRTFNEIPSFNLYCTKEILNTFF